MVKPNNPVRATMNNSIDPGDVDWKAVHSAIRWNKVSRESKGREREIPHP
jgi:hypothetical protein